MEENLVELVHIDTATFVLATVLSYLSGRVLSQFGNTVDMLVDPMNFEVSEESDVGVGAVKIFAGLFGVASGLILDGLTKGELGASGVSGLITGGSIAAIHSGINNINGE